MIITMLPDEKRLHLQHGPIDLIIEAFGDKAEIAKAYQAASKRFETVLDELVAELPLLRTPLLPSPLWGGIEGGGSEVMHVQSTSLIVATPTPNPSPQGGGEQPSGTIARAMFAAVEPHASEFITPMAAVAGAVADEILAVMTCHANLNKAYVNNGGDIALYLNPDKNQTFQTGVVSNPATNKIVTVATITADTGINGIATSGSHGRSHSLGIADSVTVFAPTAAMADAAATIIANHIDLPDCAKISRQPADQLSPDSDLGTKLVTVEVGNLTAREIEVALFAGEQKAQELCKSGLICAAFLCLQGQTKIIQWPDQMAPVVIPPITTSISQDRNCYA